MVTEREHKALRAKLIALVKSCKNSPYPEESVPETIDWLCAMLKQAVADNRPWREIQLIAVSIRFLERMAQSEDRPVGTRTALGWSDRG